MRVEGAVVLVAAPVAVAAKDVARNGGVDAVLADAIVEGIATVVAALLEVGGRVLGSSEGAGAGQAREESGDDNLGLHDVRLGVKEVKRGRWCGVGSLIL